MKIPTAPQPRAQRGVGLIEVMIALTIGLVLLMGVGQYFISMRQTASAAQQLSALQNQQRMAMYFLHVAVTGAGNVPDPANTPAAALYLSNAVFTSGQTLIGSGPSTTTKLTVRFVASTVVGQQGCSATLTPTKVYRDEFSVTSDGYLQCVETNESDSTSTTVRLVGDPVNKVTGMSIRYGVDTNTGVSSVPVSALQYLAADDMTSALWPYVMTVEVTLQFTDPMAGQFGRSSGATLSLMETIPYMSGI